MSAPCMLTFASERDKEGLSSLGFKLKKNSVVYVTASASLYLNLYCAKCHI